MTTNDARVASAARPVPRRRKALMRSKRKRFLAAAVAAATLACALWIVLWSPLLKVREVRVLGARHTSSHDVATAAQLDASDNLLLLSAGEVTRKVESLPWVAEAEVERVLPGVVRVRVVERRPAIVLALGAARWTLDERGHVLAAAEAEAELPVLAGVQIQRVEIGSRVRAAAVAGALRVWRSLPTVLSDRVAAVFAPTLERITLSLDTGVLIRYGGAHDLEAKNAVLRALLRRIEERGLEAAYIDVRVPTSPAIAPAAPAEDPVPLVGG